ncbi:hypothetical protein PaeBR_08760 [Paenibacillus sp. BR2-3]|uniref:hypothetical protein n=1 Tax=Paenibacillus sp. BR2-3 TaxID=3048494 RepID=UPI00397789CD
MSSWVYIIAVILFAIVSNVNKANKGKRKQKPAPRGAMPTFGGGGFKGERKEKGQGSGFPAQGRLYPQTAEKSFSPRRETEYDASPAFPEPARFPTPDYETGEGLSLEHPEDEGVLARTEKMQREFEQLHAAFDKLSAVDGSQQSSASAGVSAEASSSGYSGINAKQLQNGLIWAEILGPPRSRRPHSPRRES